jgi:hypothetical protein
MGLGAAVLMVDAYSTAGGTAARDLARREALARTPVAAHTAISVEGGLGANVVDAVRDGPPLDDAGLEAQRTFSRCVVNNRGWASDDLPAFLAAR